MITGLELTKEQEDYIDVRTWLAKKFLHGKISKDLLRKASSIHDKEACVVNKQ